MNSNMNPTAPPLSTPPTSAPASSNPNANASIASGTPTTDPSPTASSSKRSSKKDRPSKLRPLLPSQAGPVRTVRTGALARSASDPSTTRGRGRPRKSSGRGRSGAEGDDAGLPTPSSGGAGPSSVAMASARVASVLATPGRSVSAGTGPQAGTDDGTVYVDPEPPLGRGAACLPCRRKRARCDALRPMCTRCQKGKTGEQCAYEEPQKSTLTLLREELEATKRQVNLIQSSSSQSAGSLHAPQSGPDEPVIGEFQGVEPRSNFVVRPQDDRAHLTRARAATYSGSFQVEGYATPNLQRQQHFVSQQHPASMLSPAGTGAFPSTSSPPIAPPGIPQAQFDDQSFVQNTSNAIPPVPFDAQFPHPSMAPQTSGEDFGSFAMPQMGFDHNAPFDNLGLQVIPEHGPPLGQPLPFFEPPSSTLMHLQSVPVPQQTTVSTVVDQQRVIWNGEPPFHASATEATARTPLRPALHKSTSASSALVTMHEGPVAPKRHVSFHESVLNPARQQPSPGENAVVERRESFGTLMKRVDELFHPNEPTGTLQWSGQDGGQAGDLDLSGLLDVGFDPSNLWQPGPAMPQFPQVWHASGSGPSTSQALEVPDPTRMSAEETMELMSRPQMEMRGVSKHADPTWMNGEEPTIEFQSTLIQIFLRHRRQFASEIDVRRFIERMQKPSGSIHQPHPAFQNAIFLLACGIHLPYDMSWHEQVFRAKSQNALLQSLAGMDRLLDSARGAALLSLYHYARGDMLQGYDCIARAAAIGTSCGLDQIKSHVFRDPETPEQIHKEGLKEFTGRFSLTGFLLPLSADARELGERIHAFWSIWILDASGSATTGRERLFNDTEILTPLPLALESYSDGGATEANCFTLTEFWRTEGLIVAGRPFDPPFTHRIKATSCLEAATALSRLSGNDAAGDVWSDTPRPPVEPLTTNDFQERFGHVARTAVNLAASLPMVDKTPITEHDVHEDWYRAQIDPVMVHAQGLVHGALMVLYGIKAPVDEDSELTTINCAVDVVRTCKRIKDLDFIQLDIMLGMAWVTACHVLLRHARAIRDKQPVEQLLRDVNLLIFSLNKLGKIFPLVEIQALRVSHDVHALYGF